MRTLVIGRGLLGGALVRAAEDAVVPPTQIAWGDPPRARSQLRRVTTEFLRGSPDGWTIAWCAGVGVVGTGADHFHDEQRALEAVLDTAGRAASVSEGAFFLASSAGGVYARGGRTDADENTPASPISPYGRSKLEQEDMVRRWSAEIGAPALLGRISNLYGPAQNAAKQQGFITHVLRSLLLRRSFVLSVSGETQRDFIYADDAARRINRWLEAPPSRTAQTKVIAAGRSVSLDSVIAVCHAASGVRPRVVRAANAASALQPRYLRFRSRELVDLDRDVPCRSLEVGVHETWQQLLRAHARGVAARPPAL